MNYLCYKFFCFILCVTITILDYSAVSIYKFGNSYAQIFDITVNGTSDRSNNSSIITSINQIQSSKIKPCIDLMNPGMMTMNSYNNIQGSLKLDTNIDNLFSQIKTSLSQAATTAEQSLGNNSMAVEAYLCNANRYLVYMVWVMNRDTFSTVDVIIDPFDDRILLKNSNMFQ